DEGIKERDAERIALHNGDKDQQRRRRNEARDQNFFKTIENTKKHLRLTCLWTLTSSQRATPPLPTATASHGTRLTSIDVLESPTLEALTNPGQNTGARH